MRLLVVSDLHGKRSALETISRASERVRPDAVVMCGDITHFGPASFVAEAAAAAGAPVLAVPGNCDPEQVVEAIARPPCQSVHGARLVLGGWTFIGWGGAEGASEAPSIRAGFAGAGALLERLAGNAPPGRVVLVLHQPALGVLDEPAPGRHAGSAGMAAAVARLGPALVLSGHFHECPGIVDSDGTVFLNPGPAKDGMAARVELGGAVDAALLRV